MKAISVSRVSTEEQKDAGNSLPAQVERIKKYCEKKGFDVDEKDIFSFDESAYKEKRDDFDSKVLARIAEIINKEKLAVCFDKVDRLSRNVFDKRVAYLYQLALEGKIEIHFVSDNQIISDRLSATEKGGFSMSLVMASYYSNAISDNVKRAFETKRKNGEWTGPVRIGYVNVALDTEKRLRKNILIDVETGHLVQKMFELYATGNYSFETIRLKITEMGLRSKGGYVLSKSTVENILKDSFYCGIAMSKKYGNYPHKYPSLISRELFEKCQEVRLGRKKTPFKALSKDFLFKGLLKCKKCGCSMSPEIKTKPSGKTFTYYACTNAKHNCKRIYVPEKELLSPVYDLLDKFESISVDVQNGLVEELRKNTEAEIVFHKSQIERIRNEYDNVKTKQDRLLEMYLDNDKSITKDIYDKKHQEYSDRLQLLEIELSEHREADSDYQTTVATVISVARRAKTIFENSSDIAGKRAFLNCILQNPTVTDRKLDYTLNSPFDLVLELATYPNWLLG